MIGQTLSHYLVLEKLGEGGMGVLYRARDTRLDRDVAIKVLRPEATFDAARRRRLVQEAKAASALNHPHIVTVHDVGQASVDGQEVAFIAMECISGRGLDRLLAERRPSVAEALDIALQIAEAVAAAHGAGIIHRDLKPANVMLSDAGHVKVLDFGLAKMREGPGAGLATPEGATVTRAPAPAETTAPMTHPGAFVGTPAYMSPEQVDGKSADARSDVFAMGTLLYEMLAGQRPFRGDTPVSLLSAILRDSPPPLRSLRPDVPRYLQRVVERCLAKNPDERYASAAELLLDLTACRVRIKARASWWRAALSQPRYAVPLAVAAVALVSFLAWTWARGARARWARSVALPEIARFVERNDYYQAYWLALQAEPLLPGDPQLERFWKDRCFRLSLRTDPPGADVFVKSYGAPKGEWKGVGRTPLEGLRMPFEMLRWRIAKQGFEPVEASSDPTGPGRSLHYTLDPVGTVPPGMVRVAAGHFQFRDHPPVKLDDFWLDRYEVTNRQYKEFVDQGGYRKPEYWKQPFAKDGRILSWREAMALFGDATGRPGPSTWEAGTYADGEGEYPVGGVSWFEAAAYAEFVGKELPTFHHWFRALAPERVNLFGDIVHFSNFGGKGPVAVGALGGISPFGTFDMAGNVQEWCWTESRGQRYILGGGWTDSAMQYLVDFTTQPPWARARVHGFRCARYMAALPPELRAAVLTPQRDYTIEKPATDEAFRVYRTFYAYEPGALNATLESVEEAQDWRREKVSFDAAYGNERVPAHLFLPHRGEPPYQTVVFCPSGEAMFLKSSDDMRTAPFDYILRSGRAVLYPIYQATYERRLQKPIAGPGELRDLLTQRAKDFGRALDYLGSRSDIDRTRLAVLGVSDGLSVVALALDDRLKAGIVQGEGALSPSRMPPEIDLLNFAPRVRAPVLLLAGRYDPIYDAKGRRLFLRLLGTPEKDKRLVFVDSGHALMRNPDAMRETLDWLDRYLGPVAIP
jgi:eukaryotic-like serine/threonine-protein kinase